jgi:hypothetical protein
MVPDLGPPEDTLPRGSIDIGHSYVLLHAMDTMSHQVEPLEATINKNYLRNLGLHQDDASKVCIVHWA